MRNKILLFASGLFAGLTIGVLFSVAIKTMFTQIREMHITLNRMNVKQNELNKKIDSLKGKLAENNKPQSPPPPVNKTVYPAANYKQAQANANAAEKEAQKRDSISLSSIAIDTDIVVMTNQLVSVANVPLSNVDTIHHRLGSTDSTIARLSEVDLPKITTVYRVEFWKSPLNFKGYKMSKGKIILYGIAPSTAIKLTENEDGKENNYYLCVNQSAYNIEYTDDYKPFEKVTDKLTLKRLGL